MCLIILGVYGGTLKSTWSERQRKHVRKGEGLYIAYAMAVSVVRLRQPVLTLYVATATVPTQENTIKNLEYSTKIHGKPIT